MPTLTPRLALVLLAASVAACQPSLAPTGGSLPSRDRPPGVPQTVLSDGDLAEQTN